MKFSKKWLQEYIVEALPENNLIIDKMSKQAFEVEEVTEFICHDGSLDSVFEMKILPNRAHDCLGHLGVARELAAVFDLSLKDSAKYTWNDISKNANYEFLQTKISEQKEKNIEVQKVEVFVEDKNACTRLMSVRIDGIKVAASPLWLKDRLEAIGQRSINNIVDITNFVQFSLNKPMHAYDATNINGKLCALFAHDGESLTTLDDKEIRLDNSTLVIADSGIEGSVKSKALGLAGIKGGKLSGVNNNTTSVILESANFDSDLIRSTSQKYNIRTDASKRFENGISDSLVADGLYMTARMIIEIAGGSETAASGISDTGESLKDFTKIEINIKDIQRISGADIPKEKSVKILESLGLEVEVQESGKIIVTVPNERLDLNMMDDIAEEVVRVYGLDNISSAPVSVERKGKVNKILFIETLIKKIFLEKNFNEVQGYAFTDDGDIAVMLPLASDKAYLRTDLSSGAEKIFNKNKDLSFLYESETISFFEFGNVFLKSGEVRRCVIVKDDGKKKSRFIEEIENMIKEIENYFDIKIEIINIKEKPASVEFSVTDLVSKLDAIKYFGENNEKLENFEKINYEVKNNKYKAFSLFPFISRDISMWVPSGIDFESIKNDIENMQLNNYLKSYVFDSYTPSESDANFGKVSTAFRIIFQSFEKTLTDEEVEKEMQRVYEYLKTQGFEVR